MADATRSITLTPLPPITTTPAERPLGSSRIGSLVRRALGLRQTVAVAGVRYRELTTEPLRTALSRKGSGHKDFDVTFPDGAAMTIRCTPTRMYPDLWPRARGAHLARPDDAIRQRSTPLVRPGMRALIVNAGTGSLAAWLSALVGPSGAVVSLDRDAESTSYATHRHRLRNVAFENGGQEALAGELDGSFDAVIGAASLPIAGGHREILAELWRVVAPGGWLLVAAPRAPGTRPTTAPTPDPSSAHPFAPEELVSLLTELGPRQTRPTEDGPDDPESPSLPLVHLLGEERDDWILAIIARPPTPGS